MELKLVLLSAVCLISVVSAWDLKPEEAEVFTGSDVNITCLIEKGVNDTENVALTWQHEGELLFFNDQRGQADSRMSITLSGTEMSVTITGVGLGDEGIYECNLLKLRPPIHKNLTLVVNRKPEVYIEDKDVAAMADQTATVAVCSSSGSKPAPEMWFTDANGNEVAIDYDTDWDQTKNADGTFDTTLRLTRKFSAIDDGKMYTCNVDTAGEIQMETTKPVEVHYAPTMSLSDPADYQLLEEEGSFYIRCYASGNPPPAITWTFIPAYETNITLPAGQDLPSNFVASNGELRSSALALTTSDSTNNGTFTCTASNSIDAVSKSFRMEVFALPVTTVATTPALTETSTSPPESTAFAQPNTAGSDAAVIGGVVAVAVFVLIVAIVLVVRYFTSHKGTYRTHEVKTHDFEAERGGDDDHNLMDDEDKEFGKKKTEYFM